MDFVGYLISLGLILVLIYLIITYIKDTKADLTEAVTIFVSAAGLVSSFQLGLIAIFKVQIFIGEMQDQRIQVMVGAFAVFWVSVQAILQIYAKHYRCDTNVLINS
ncbi:hypothetical protein WCT79_21000 [Pectobacterium carotovorum]|uniref:hypothetical protein n=1 Tax=Pectobacterium carotovorum TaxID=554 RepID=UPI003017BC63